jgi:ribonuclease HII
MKLPARFNHEQRLWKRGIKRVTGVDEVGRGAWAGPVVAAAVVFPRFFKPPFKLYDSKLLLPSEREEISKKIRKVASVGVGVVDVGVIDKIGVGRASQKAFRRALMSLSSPCDYYLIDAFYIRYWSKENQLPIKKGDKFCASIAAASIVAKVYRDNLMRVLAKNYPQYRFHTHKGYGTPFHQQAIRQHKLSALHRTSFNLTPYLNG